jgi:hypothetical protein
MEKSHLLLAAASNAPMDWVWGAIASLLFVGVIVVPAAALNARDRKRRQDERASASATTEAPGA